MVRKGFILLLMGCLLFVAACGSNGSGNNTTADNQANNQNNNPPAQQPAAEQTEPVTIKFMQYTASGSQEETLNEMIAAFEAANPDVKVDLEIVEFSNYYTKLNTVIASNAAPDVFEVGYENFMTFAAKDVLLDLTSVIEGDSAFNPGEYKQLAYDAFKYNDKQYGVVQNFSNVVLFYNKDLFDQAGAAYPEPSWTWEDELKAAEALTDANSGVWGTYAPIQFWEFYKTIAQNGGGIFDGDTPVVNSAANVEALNWMLDKAQKHNVSPPLNDDTFSQPDADLNAFNTGKLAMLRAGIWNFGRFAEAGFNWDIALEPGNTNKAHHFFADGLVASKNTEHTEAAWKFIKFMTSDKFVVDKRIEKGWSIPAVANDSVMEVFYSQPNPPQSKKVVTEALDSLVLPPVGPMPEKWNELTGAVGEELDKARLGAADAQTALDNAQKKVEALLAK